MKKTRKLFLFIFLIFSMFLSGCSFLPFFEDIISQTSSEPEETINSFTFETDEKMVYEPNDGDDYYCLTLYAGESYQIKTTIDDILGDTYYLQYKTDDEINGKFTLSETGYIETSAALEEFEVFVIDVELYKIGSSKKITSKYFIFSLRVGEYANISLTNENLKYDNDTSSYSLTINSGDSYFIAYKISSNTAYTLTFSLTDPSYSTFMNVDDKGKITTEKVNDNKVGEITIKLIGANGILDIVYLKITLIKSEDIKNELKIINQNNSLEVNDGDVIDLYQNQEISFEVKYNNELKTNVMTISDNDILEVINETNTIKGKDIGKSYVTFTYENEKVIITVNVIKDKLISIEAKNQGADFVIINNVLRFLNKMFVTYQSGTYKEVSDNSLIRTSIVEKDDEYKTVEFTYEEDGETVSISYDVKWFIVVEYSGKTSAYDNNDFKNNTIYGNVQLLPSEGNVKLLVIPVWFEDSNLFFDISQKEQIVEDIEYTMKGNRPNSEFKSVKQYYEAQSYGAITMDITVSDFYSSTTSYQDYSDCIDYKQTNTHILATDAISWYFSSTTEKFEDYDLNGDGFVDGLILFYGANYYGAPGDGNRSFAFEKDNYGDSKYLYNVLSFCPIGGLYGLQKKEPTTQLTIDDLSSNYSKAFRSSSRTVIHEIGHMFGNSDLYENSTQEEKYSPAGGFVMQDNNYGSHDPYHVNKIGWSKPQIYASNDYELGEKITLHIADFQSSGQNIILTNTWNSSNSLYDEYLILELFAPVGLNEYDSKISFLNNIKSGIRLWHVNSLLIDYNSNKGTTSEIIDGHQYNLAYSNYDVESEYDLVHMIRNNPNEEYHTNSQLHSGAALFNEGDSFDMETFKSQFVKGNKLDNDEKLGWSFKVESIYNDIDGSYGAVITLERTDNVRTEFSQTVSLNRSDLSEPTGEEDYSDEIFGENSVFSLIYKYVTPPSVYNQNYPISSNGMCLFASSDGNGGYIDLTINPIDGKEVYISSISITYSKLTNASLTVIADNNIIEGTKYEVSDNTLFGYVYEVNAPSIRIQNQYKEKIDYWSVIALYELKIDYIIK